MPEQIGAIGPGDLGRVDQTGPAQPKGAGFKDVLANSFDQVNRLQQDADTAITRLQTGQDVNVTEVLVAVEKADLAFKTLMQIRNKLVDAYKQIEQMRI